MVNKEEEKKTEKIKFQQIQIYRFRYLKDPVAYFSLYISQLKKVLLFNPVLSLMETSNDRFNVNSHPEIKVIYLREHLIYLIMCINH